MEDGSSATGLLIGLLCLLLLGSASFSATEAALFSLDRVQRRRLQADRSIRSQLIARVLHRPRQLLSTILFGNTLVNVATASVAALLAERLMHGHSLVVAIIADTALVLLIGEIIPKTIAVNTPRSFANAVIMPLHAFTRLSAPVVTIFDRAARGILRALKVPEEAGSGLSPSELELLFEEAGRRATITPHETRIARNIMRFSETTAEEIMTPRVDLVTASIDISRENLAALMREKRHSRIPIHDGGVDNIVGFVSSKEFLLNPERSVRELINPVSIFPEGAKIDRVFRHMQKHYRNVVVVVSEYGETSGIVTIEDVVEEIVGEIYDEYEKEEQLIKELGPGRWLVRCRVSLEDVNETCDLLLPESESVTLNGYLCDEFGEIPIRGRSIERAGARFTVEESTRRRIISCRVERLDAPEVSGGS